MSVQNEILQNCGLEKCKVEQNSQLDAFFLLPVLPHSFCKKSIKISNIEKLDSWLSWIGCVPQFQQDDSTFENYIGIEKKDYDKLKSESEQVEIKRLQTGWLGTRPNFEPFKEVIFIEQIIIPKEDKILIIGDIHSSLTSLLNIFKFWHEKGWLTNDFQLAKGFHVFFLGDVVDRGPYGTELISLIFLLKLVNKERVTYINGNHENCETFMQYGMGVEMMQKFQQTTLDEFLSHMSFLKYQPSTVIIKYGDQKFQLSHGAFTENTLEQSKISALLKSNKSFLYLREFAKKCTPVTENNVDNQKWGDFIGTKQDKGSSARGKFIKVFGWKSTETYLKKMGITAIISGHQDLSNFTMLLTPLCSKKDKELDPNYSTLYRPLYYGTGNFPSVVSFQPGKDFIAVNTSTALDAKGNIALQYDCFLFLFA